jgi:hypothetical protein
MPFKGLHQKEIVWCIPGRELIQTTRFLYYRISSDRKEEKGTQTFDFIPFPPFLSFGWEAARKKRKHWET